MKGNPEFGAFIKEKREAAGYTPTVIANKMGISPSSYSNFERGDNSFPEDILMMLSKILGFDFVEERKIRGIPQRGWFEPRKTEYKKKHRQALQDFDLIDPEPDSTDNTSTLNKKKVSSRPEPDEYNQLMKQRLEKMSDKNTERKTILFLKVIVSEIVSEDDDSEVLAMARDVAEFAENRHKKETIKETFYEPQQDFKEYWQGA